MMFAGTRDALSQSPESYCAAAKTQRLTMGRPNVPIPAPHRRRCAEQRPAGTAERGGRVAARSQEIDRLTERLGCGWLVGEQIDAEQQKRVDACLRCALEEIDRAGEPLHLLSPLERMAP